MALLREIHLSHLELYDRVWARPLRDVAQDLGLSDVGLAKLCRRSGIPLPPRGFHLLAPGPQRDKLVVELPSDIHASDRLISFRVPEESVVEAQSRSREEFNALLASSSPLSREKSREIDLKLAEIRRLLNPKNIDDRGVILSPSVEFAVRVSPSSLQRALDILAALSRRVFALGGSFSEGEGWRKERLCLLWQGYDFAFKVEEASSREVVTVRPGKRDRLRLSHYRGQDWHLVPTGKLTLEGRGPGYESLVVRDGKTLIEERIDELAMRMYEVIAAQREEDRVKAIREERTVAHLQKKDEARRAEEFEQRRRKQLRLEARQFRQALALHQYIDAVARAPTSGPLSSEDAKREWLEWARSYVASLDPIAAGWAGTQPPYPEFREITEFPSIYLSFDDPEEAERELERNPWNRW